MPKTPLLQYQSASRRHRDSPAVAIQPCSTNVALQPLPAKLDNNHTFPPSSAISRAASQRGARFPVNCREGQQEPHNPGILLRAPTHLFSLVVVSAQPELSGQLRQTHKPGQPSIIHSLQATPYCCCNYYYVQLVAARHGKVLAPAPVRNPAPLQL